MIEPRLMRVFTGRTTSNRKGAEATNVPSNAAVIVRVCAAKGDHVARITMKKTGRPCRGT